MTTYRKTYALEVFDLLALTALFLGLIAYVSPDPLPGIFALAGFAVSLYRLGMTLGRWGAAHLDEKEARRERLEARRARRSQWTDEEREERAASKARHPSARGGLTGGGQVDRGPAHNHGPNEGLGLACPEYAAKDGGRRGLCVITETIRKNHEAQSLGRNLLPLEVRTWTDPITGKVWDL